MASFFLIYDFDFDFDKRQPFYLNNQQPVLSCFLTEYNVT